MTISGWHDDARHKDAGHDEMVADVWRFHRSKIGEYAFVRRNNRYHLIEAQIEFPFVLKKRSQDRHGVIVGFADIAVILRTKQSDETEAEAKHRGFGPFQAKTWYFFLEIKPEIYSVGGLIRQCVATDYAARRAGLEDYEVYPVVRKDDPRTPLLKELYTQVISWPGRWNME